MTNHQSDSTARKHPNRPFAIAMIVLVLLFLAGLAGMAVWMVREMGEFNPQAILSRITGKEVAMQLTDVLRTEDGQVVSQSTTQAVQTSQVEETAVSGVTEDNSSAEPTPGVTQATRTPIPTPMPTTEVAVATTEAPLATDTGSAGATTNETSEATSEASTEATTGQSTASSSDPTSGSASETPTGSTPASTTSELPDTGFMDELGLPMLAMLGVILFFTILLIKYLRTSR